MAEILGLVDEEYITRMTGFEVDCNNGKGDPMACHQVGEFFSLVKNDRERAGTVFEKNCTSQKYSASCFNLAKLYLTGKGVVQSDAKAEEFFKQSCDGGHLYGCYHQVSHLLWHQRIVLSQSVPSVLMSFNTISRRKFRSPNYYEQYLPY